MQELLVDFITSLDGYGAAEGWPGFWGLQGPEYPNVWEALYDPDGSFIYASDINQGFYALDLCERARGAPQCPLPPTQGAGR